MLYEYKRNFQHDLSLYQQSCAAKQARRKREPKTECTQHHGSTTCSSGTYLHPSDCKSTHCEAASCCLEESTAYLLCCLPNPLALPSRSIPSQSFYMLTVWISLPPQECPEPLASQEPNSLTNSPQSSTDLSQSYTDVPLCHPPRQPNTCISQGAPFPSPALPPQMIRLSFLHTLA